MTDETYVGANGRAQRLTLHPSLQGADTTLAWWLLTGTWHPIWPQFVISVIHLRDVEGREPATLQFPGATHELLVLALNPGEPPKIHDAVKLERKGLKLCGYLEPIDVVHQFEATDEQMVDLAKLAAQACVDGRLNPSTDDAREFYHEQWLTACVKTLAHMRGEEHAP